MQTKQKCICCQRMLPLSSFWRKKTNPPVRKDYLKLERPDNKCKECYLQTVDNNNSNTFMSILQHFNVPYIEKEWQATCDFAEGRPGSVLGRYLSKMKLCAYYSFGFEDSDHFNEVRKNEK